MGTSWTVRGFAPAAFDPTRLERDVVSTLDLIVQQMSPWVATSELSRFNALAAGEHILLPREILEVLQTALTIAAESDGAFDPTLGALVNLWGFGPNAAPNTPTQSDLAAARASANWRRVALSGATLTQAGDVQLDLNGIAKGYAVDRIAACLTAAGLTSHLVEIGGELRGAGVKPDGEPWWAEIEAPPGFDRARTLAALYDLSLATSGDYRRGEIVNGALIAHTISPSTGAPIDNGLAAATVFHPSCMHADAYATALSVMGLERAQQFATTRDIAAIFVQREAAGFTEHLTPLAQQMAS